MIMKTGLFEIQIFLKRREVQRRNALTVVANGLKITCAKFGAKFFARAQDATANVMYYVMGGSSSFP